ncbi:hypothetical protein FM076_32950 [Streptomyces albus subsp. chlorinus]|uniref:hypothetical protein n=1 Tax=Streptomyces albus TaxID=1888 RepID=UPI00156EB22D|nr:hypothetical protein [Streptomyces albus]NSC25698.1 hypothetical protein [Streptomyces albus subsp. chlorinus]
MPTAEPLRYAVDITLDDVDALTAFLMKRLNGQHHLRVGTEEYRTNSALCSVVPGFAGSLSYQFGDAAVQKAQEDSLKGLTRFQEIRSTWNDLVGVASKWEDVDGFDTARWRRVRFHDAEDEEEFRQWEAKEKASADQASAFVSEYRIPGPRLNGRITGEFVVARDHENPDWWAVFEGSAQARHWDGGTWQHARFTGTSPYLFSREAALALAHQHAAQQTAGEQPA